MYSTVSAIHPHDTPDKTPYDLIIIGGGAAGLFAAVQAARRGVKTTVLERNRIPGKKLRITGKGRCNLTNNCTDEEFFKNLTANSKFLYSAYSAFGAQDTMKCFEDLGVPLKTERGSRVFPVSDNAHDIADALTDECKRLGVTIKEFFVKEISFFETPTAEINNNENLITKSSAAKLPQSNLSSRLSPLASVLDGKGNCLYAKNIIIAAGGASYPMTGSDGNGYNLVKALGLTVTDIRPSLVPLVCKEAFVRELRGLSLRNVTLTVKENAKTVFTEQGEMLFTDYGITGPLVLSASVHIKNPANAVCHIDLKPALDFDTLDKRILRDFGENPNRIFANALDKLLPASLRPVMVRLSGVDPKKQVNAITKQERLRLVELFKSFTLSIIDFRPITEAIITRGGVSVKDIDPKTMACKTIPNLYFAGEIMDLDAYTGGFNLQIAFTTAFAAAIAVSENVNASAN